jgi:hypothetical protein
VTSTVRARAVFWLIAFGMCFGLGYASLNRYDARKTGNVDAAQYYRIVEASPAKAAGHWRYRILVPYLAKPIYYATQAKLASWDPVFFSLLIVNSAFVASTALLVFFIAVALGYERAVAIIASLAYLLNFDVVNEQLAGMIDSAEAFTLALLLWALLRGHWKLLPLLGIIGCLGKETFLPLAAALAGLWWLAHAPQKQRTLSQALWIAAMSALGLLTVVVIRSLVEGHAVLPWQIAASERSDVGLVRGLFGVLGARTFWYPFVWQLPLAIWQAKRLPRAFMLATAGSASLALFLGAFNDAMGNASRPMLDVAGPLLSISAALALVRLGWSMSAFETRPTAVAIRGGD